MISLSFSIIINAFPELIGLFSIYSALSQTFTGTFSATNSVISLLSLCHSTYSSQAT
ncbi:MAG: hypothetical protein Q9M97_03375 [Candidatus Gracilibacteria bacterium]|nr:hypothetical protein [Candidatus Gracilibacteria bacterium]